MLQHRLQEDPRTPNSFQLLVEVLKEKFDLFPDLPGAGVVHQSAEENRARLEKGLCIKILLRHSWLEVENTKHRSTVAESDNILFESMWCPY